VFSVTFNSTGTSNSTTGSSTSPNREPFATAEGRNAKQDASTPSAKGKEHAVGAASPREELECDAEETLESPDEEDFKPVKKGRGPPKKNDLSHAAKNMKKT
jgi:hypothetical protein